MEKTTDAARMCERGLILPSDIRIRGVVVGKTAAQISII